jgi:phospholipase D1/2
MSTAAGARDAGILRPGRNCWRLQRASRFRCVQDAGEYFRLVRDAILQARRSIFILGWDITANVDLLPGEQPGSAPTRLKDLLDVAARRRPALHCFVLIWDYAAFYAFERDPLSRLRLGWGSHRRVHFRFDDQHPLGASHHQKIVVVDDALAFAGGTDLTAHRWDTTEHLVDNPLRVNLVGTAYTPYHEVQAMVDGPVAASLGELARERWRRRGSRRMPPVVPSGESLWPDAAETDLTDVDVGIARTEPRFGGRPEVRECEALFLDGIASARDTIYIENQYFTNPKLGAALGERLREERGPEVVVVGPRECEGWLEKKTMGALRWKLLSDLKAADRHGRLRLCFPLASRSQDVCTFVHSKVMCVDDTFLRIGSANLSNRSMAFDTECDLAVDVTRNDGARAGVRAVRARLLAEHLGVPPAEVERAAGRAGSLLAAIDALGGGDRTLAPIDPQEKAIEEPGAIVRGAADPEEPSALSRVVDELLPDIEERDERSRRLVLVLPASALALLVLVAWRSTDLSFWLSLTGLRELMELGPGSLPMLLSALGLLVAGGLLFLPMELLVVASVLWLGPLRGGLVALAAAAGSALLGHAAGRLLGLRRVEPLVGRRGTRLWRMLRGSGLVAVAVMRVASVASATSIHLLCGAAGVALRDCLLGTLLGVLPVLLAVTALAGFLRHAVLHPGLGTAALAAGMAVVLALVTARVRTSLLARRLGPSMTDHRERAAFG